MGKSSQNKSNYAELIGILCAIAIIFTIWISYPRFMQFMDEPLANENAKVIVPFKPNLEEKAVESESESKFQKVGETYGTYGDSYGSLNTLFSGLAFAVLIISLFMQRQELRAQREELEAQRNEIKESNAIADAQRAIAEKQRLITEQQADLNQQQIYDAKVQNFYTLLFKFLDEKRRKIDELELSRSGNIRGQYVFDRFHEYAVHRLNGSFLETNAISNSHIDELNLVIIDAVNEGYENTNNTIIENEYFEYICFILRYIDENEHLGITQNAIKIFISFQSFSEMFAMFLIARKDALELQENELEDFVLKYSLLRKINTHQLFDDGYILELIQQTLGEKSYTPNSIRVA